MRRKKRSVRVQPTTIKHSRKLLGEPFTESDQDGNIVSVDSLTINDRGVIVMNKEVMNKMDPSGDDELVLMTMSHDSGTSAVMLTPSCRLFPNDNKRTYSKADHGAD